MKKYLTLTEYRRKQRSQRDREAVAGLIQNRGMGFVPSIGAGPTGASIFTVDGVALSDDDIDVNDSSNWTINGDGTATVTSTGTNRDLGFSSGAVEGGVTYDFSFDFDSIDSGDGRMVVGGAFGDRESTAGTQTGQLTATTTALGFRNFLHPTVATISNVILTRV